MKKNWLLFAEEGQTTLTDEVLSRKDVNVLFLRCGRSKGHRAELRKEEFIDVPLFIIDRSKTIEQEVRRFKHLCARLGISIDFFYNTSEFHQEALQYFADLLALPGSLTRHQALVVRDKVVMKRKLADLGFRTTKYVELQSEQDASRFVTDNGGFPVIIKWRKGLSSKEVYRVDSIDELTNLRLNYSSGRYIAENFCPHLIWCIDALIQNGKVIGVFLSWLPYPNLDFTLRKDKFAQITVHEKPDEIRFDEKALIQRLVEGVRLENGMMHLEAFVDDEGQPIICEFAWRPPGEHMLSNHSLTFGLNIPSLLIDIIIGKQIGEIDLNGRQCVGDMFLPLKAGTVTRVSSSEELSALPGVLQGKVQYRVGDEIVPKRQYTDCSGWFQVSGSTKEEVLDRMDEVYDKFVIETC